jgi:UDP-N-acetyl-D-glucosamine dehydrogenase
MSTYDRLLDLFKSGSPTLGVIGLGYVGLPLAYTAHEAGLRVIGFDVDQAKIRLLREGTNYLKHLGSSLTETLAISDRFHPTSDIKELGAADAIVICVPTPLGRHQEPDLSFVTKSGESIGQVLRSGQLIVLESTSYPGTTRDDLLTAIERAHAQCGGNLVLGDDFFVAFSPEREDPGRKSHNTRTIPKLVGGLDENSTRLATVLYRRFVDTVVPVRNAEIAESAKILENVFRSVNIALVNELKTILTPMGIDVWEVIEAASTKPFGFMKFTPGPGLGGHCIPIDPFYLTWKAREFGMTTRFIELAGEINTRMPRYVVDRTAHALNEEGKSLNGSQVLVVGLSYKANIDDTRESPAAEIIELLEHAGARVSYHDPHVPVFPSMRRHQREMKSLDLGALSLAPMDCAIIVTDHDAVDYAALGRGCKLIIDTRNSMAKFDGISAKVVKA